ncbi:TetR/AcrR family transcriptional regulator [Rhizorhabdus wittichii]|uniref:TetR/AcrR family transcriptional regulator n=1 Tax=Rhizorhabdus wittichii TaxID=160791 RepID=UPI00037DEFAF|nr:TetR/AcrR family transcriptional regulator [Rhizorhabdus wittichii]
MENNLAGSPKVKRKLTPKGMRSRDNLKKAARDALNTLGYTKLRVQDITQAAEVADGLFYRYFSDLREIMLELAEDLFRDLLEDTVQIRRDVAPYQWLYDIHRVALVRFSNNPGILACLFGLAGDSNDFSTIWQVNARKWNLQVAAFIESETDYSTEEARRMAYVLGAMTEGVIYQYLVRRSDDLVTIGGEDEVAGAIAEMWYRTIFLKPSP